MKVRVRVIRAVEDIEATAKYIDGHYKVLESYGVTKVTSADRSWTENPNVYLILFESMEDFRILGGGRLQLKSERFPLPFENAIEEIDPKIKPYMNQFGDLEAAEYCGLWNSKEVAGYGIGSIYLIRVGVAIASQLNIKRIFALCSPPTFRISTKVGYQLLTDLGDEGKFYYPKEGLIATLLHIEDVINLPYAIEEEKSLVMRMRNEDEFLLTERGPKGEMEVKFEVQIPVLKI